MTTPQDPHNININVNTNASAGSGRGRGPRSNAEVIGVVVITVALVLAVHGLLLPALIIGSIIAALYFYGKHKANQQGQSVSTSQSAAVTQPEPPDVIGATCMHCGGIAWQHVAPDGRQLDVRVFHGLPPRLTP